MNKTVFITGGAQGIGYGTARCFARKQFRVVIADANEAAAREAAATLQAETGTDALGIVCDVTSRAAVESAVAAALSAFGRIDVLVNNAGICPFQDIMEMTSETFEKVLAVNLSGAFHCTQTVARHFIERSAGSDPGGRVLFITSLSDRETGPSQVDYAASKSGLKGLMFGFATALAKYGVTCNAVAPGMILTPMTEHHWSQPVPSERIKHLVPLGRIGTPEDIGNACVLLASAEAGYINGVTLTVDGGFSVLARG